MTCQFLLINTLIFQFYALLLTSSNYFPLYLPNFHRWYIFSESWCCWAHHETSSDHNCTGSHGIHSHLLVCDTLLFSLHSFSLDHFWGASSLSGEIVSLPFIHHVIKILILILRKCGHSLRLMNSLREEARHLWRLRKLSKPILILWLIHYETILSFILHSSSSDTSTRLSTTHIFYYFCITFQ